MLLTTALLLIALLVKHFLFDFPFQTQQDLQYKGIFGNPLGFIHSIKHAAGTFTIFLFIAPAIASYFLYIDLFTHYFIDWSKVKLSKGLTPADKKFWVLLGLDQLAHSLIYILMIPLYFYLKVHSNL